MKEFSLEEYLKNPDREVVTRDGRKVRIICTDFNYPIVALVERKSAKGESIIHYTKEGKIYTDSGLSDTDLFFAPTKHEGWINIYAGINDDSHPGNHIFESKEEAEEEGEKASGYVTTIKIEWEE